MVSLTQLPSEQGGEDRRNTDYEQPGNRQTSSIHNVINGKLTWHEAGQQLCLTVRQIGYMCARVRQEGHRGIIHRLRGRPSNHRLDPELLDQALELVQTHYADFGPTLAREKLEKRHQIQLSTFTLRQRMIEAGIWKPKIGAKIGVGKIGVRSLDSMGKSGSSENRGLGKSGSENRGQIS